MKEQARADGAVCFFSLTSMRTREISFVLPTHVECRYVHIKMLTSHGNGRNIDTERIALLGYDARPTLSDAAPLPADAAQLARLGLQKEELTAWTRLSHDHSHILRGEPICVLLCSNPTTRHTRTAVDVLQEIAHSGDYHDALHFFHHDDSNPERGWAVKYASDELAVMIDAHGQKSEINWGDPLLWWLVIAHANESFRDVYQGSMNTSDVRFWLDAYRSTPVHNGFYCDCCSEMKYNARPTWPIRGPRYHCLECSSFDLCSSCFSQQISLHNHHPSHAYMVVVDNVEESTRASPAEQWVDLHGTPIGSLWALDAALSESYEDQATSNVDVDVVTMLRRHDRSIRLVHWGERQLSILKREGRLVDAFACIERSRRLKIIILTFVYTEEENYQWHEIEEVLDLLGDAIAEHGQVECVEVLGGAPANLSTTGWLTPRLQTGLKMNRTISTLGLSSMAMGEMDARALSAVLRVTVMPLTQLYLSDSSFPDTGMEGILTTLSTNESIRLTTLQLMGNDIHHGAADALARLVADGQLQWLGLSITSLQPTGLMSLLQAMKGVDCPLVGVDLGFTDLADDRVALVALVLLTNRHLERLRLSHCDITDIGAQHLAGRPTPQSTLALS